MNSWNSIKKKVSGSVILYMIILVMVFLELLLHMLLVMILFIIVIVFMLIKILSLILTLQFISMGTHMPMLFTFIIHQSSNNPFNNLINDLIKSNLMN